MKSKSIFISHSKKNKELADKLVDLIETGVGISSNDIFCSSLEGMGIPSGTNFVDFIKSQISDPKIVIMLLTTSYFKSNFCLCELGASWILSHKIIPLIIQPLEYKDIKDVLTGVQVLKIDDKNDLNQMQNELIDYLNISGKAFARWEVKRDKFLTSIQDLIKCSDEDEIIDLTKYKELDKNYNESKDEIAKLVEELDKKDAIIEKLKKAKDAEQVKNVIEESLDDISKFEAHLELVKKSFLKLPSIVTEALFYHYKGEMLQWPGFGEDYRREAIKEAIDNDYLNDTEDGIEIINEDPRISKAIKALSKLENFVNKMESNIEFNDYYSEEYDHRLNFNSKRFWDTHLL